MIKDRKNRRAEVIKVKTAGDENEMERECANALLQKRMSCKNRLIQHIKREIPGRGATGYFEGSINN